MSQYYVQRSSSLVLVPEEFPLLQWSTTRSSSQSLISTELLEDNTSCSCLEMFASISKLFERIYKPGAFFINALSLTNTLYSGMKNKLSLGFSDTKKKKLKRTGVSSILAATVIGHFSGIFRIRSSSISAYSCRLKDWIRCFLNPKNRLWYIPCLFIIVPAQEREQSISLGWKGSVPYSDAD